MWKLCAETETCHISISIISCAVRWWDENTHAQTHTSTTRRPHSGKRQFVCCFCVWSSAPTRLLASDMRWPFACVQKCNNNIVITHRLHRRLGRVGTIGHFLVFPRSLRECITVIPTKTATAEQTTHNHCKQHDCPHRCACRGTSSCCWWWWWL